MRSGWFYVLGVALALLGCGSDGGGQAEASSSESGDGDGDGDPSPGDGDGDPSTGDGDGDPSTGDGDPSTGDGDGDRPDGPIETDSRVFMFGHSLLVHEFTTMPTPSDELTVPHWSYLLAQEAGYGYAAAGQYGFLLQHANLPPFSQWGFDLVPNPWDSDTQSFAEADFTTVLLTAGNFVQYKPPTEPYDGDNPQNLSPVDATTIIVDWVREQEPGVRVVIYENWPDMGGTIAAFPPTAAELEAYHATTRGAFHAWWLAYHDAIMAARPEAEVRMIPVGPAIARVLTETPLSTIPTLELYEDDAPHGRPTLYFLAGLVTYMGSYGVPAPDSFEIPALVHPLVGEHYDEVVAVIWDELVTFTDARGVSRVW